MPQATYLYAVPQYVQPVSMVYQDTHTKAIGYVLWLIGFTGAHRFYYGKPITGMLWFFTFGLLGIGWIVDAFLIPQMDDQANHRFAPGPIDYSLVWVMLIFLGAFGLHRFLQEKYVTGVIYLLTFGLFGFGLVYDILTLNYQIDSTHRRLLRIK